MQTTSAKCKFSYGSHFAVTYLLCLSPKESLSDSSEDKQTNADHNRKLRPEFDDLGFGQSDNHITRGHSKYSKCFLRVYDQKRRPKNRSKSSRQ